MLLRSFLRRCETLGLTEVRLAIDSSNLPLLRAASLTGFRPIKLTEKDGKVSHMFAANPQLPEPPIAEIKERIAALGKLLLTLRKPLNFKQL